MLWGLETSFWSPSQLAELTNSVTTLDLFLPTSGDRPFYGAMVEQRDGRSWLRDDDDDDDEFKISLSEREICLFIVFIVSDDHCR